MKSFFTVILLMFAVISCVGQTKQVGYYKDIYFNKETTLEKAKFKRTIIKEPDGVVTTEVVNVKRNEVISLESFKGNEQVGVWKVEKGKGYEERDYSFDIVYSKDKCIDTIAGVDNLLQNNDELRYVAPKIATDESYASMFMSKNISYPRYAKENGIEGIVKLAFTITKEGEVKDIVVNQGVHLTLDKEAVRVVRKLKFSNPPTIDGEPREVCLSLPVTYKLL